MKKTGIFLFIIGIFGLFKGSTLAILMGRASFGSQGEDIAFAAIGIAVPLLGAYLYLKGRKSESVEEENHKNKIIGWVIIYILSFISIPLSLLGLNSLYAGIIDELGSIVRFILILNFPFIKLPRYVRIIIATLSLSSILGTIIGFGLLLSRFDTKNVKQIKVREFIKGLIILLIGAWALDALTILPAMKFHNSVQFSSADFLRGLIALAILFSIFKYEKKPKFNLALLSIFTIIVFLFYQYSVFLGHFLLSWPL